MPDREVPFAFPLDKVLAKLSYEFLGDASFRETAFAYTEEAFKSTDQSEVVLRGQEDNWLRIEGLMRALKGTVTILDIAKRLIETNHPRIAGFSDIDRRFLLHTAAMYRIRQLEGIVLDEEAKELYYPHAGFMSINDFTEKIKRLKDFQEELSQRVSSPNPEAPRL